MRQKVQKKSSAFWKHGKHKGLLEIAINENKAKKRQEALSPLDTSKSGWTARQTKPPAAR